MNTITLYGRLTKDPELKNTNSGKKVTSFSVAVNRAGSRDNVDFLNCVAWEGRAETICKYMTKGSAIYIHGELQTRKYQDNAGNDRVATEILVRDFEFGAKSSGSDSPKVASPYDGVVVGTPNMSRPVQSAPVESDLKPFESDDDDLPF